MCCYIFWVWIHGRNCLNNVLLKIKGISSLLSKTGFFPKCGYLHFATDPCGMLHVLEGNWESLWLKIEYGNESLQTLLGSYQIRFHERWEVEAFPSLFESVCLRKFFYTKNPLSFPPNPSIQTHASIWTKSKDKYFLTKKFNLRMKIFEFHPGDLLAHSSLLAKFPRSSTPPRT